MVGRRVCTAAGALIVAALLTACAVSPELRDEEAAIRLLRDYEMAVATYDADAAVGMFTDDFEGWRGSGKDGIRRMVEGMAEREGTYELDLTEAAVTVDGDTATVANVVALTGRWEMRSTYVLARAGDGWRIASIEFQR